MVKAILNNKDHCLYCPICSSRIAVREPKPSGVFSNRMVLYGKCKCPNGNTEWSFTFWLVSHEYEA